VKGKRGKLSKRRKKERDIKEGTESGKLMEARFDSTRQEKRIRNEDAAVPSAHQAPGMSKTVEAVERPEGGGSVKRGGGEIMGVWSFVLNFVGGGGRKEPVFSSRRGKGRRGAGKGWAARSSPDVEGRQA